MSRDNSFTQYLDPALVRAPLPRGTISPSCKYTLPLSSTPFLSTYLSLDFNTPRCSYTRRQLPILKLLHFLEPHFRTRRSHYPRQKYFHFGSSATRCPLYHHHVQVPESYPQFFTTSELLCTSDEIMAPVRVTEDYYAVLKVSRDATEALISKQYKILALKIHPDKNPGPGATAAFQLVCQSCRIR